MKKHQGIESHLDWSKHKTNYFRRLRNQPIRNQIKKIIVEEIKKEKFSKIRYKAVPYKIMEIGFGDGYEYQRLKKDLKKHQVKYIGVDYTLKFVEAVKRKYPEADWFQGDVRDLAFDDKAVDLIFAYHVLEHQKGLKEVKKAIKEMCRVAKKKVIIIWFKAPSLVDKTRKWKDGRFLVYKYSAADIWRVVLETDFMVKEIFWQNPWHNTVWILEKKK